MKDDMKVESTAASMAGLKATTTVALKVDMMDPTKALLLEVATVAWKAVRSVRLMVGMKVYSTAALSAD